MRKLCTLGEVSDITGIPKRQIKYYVERGMIQPSEKMYEGGKEFWLYSEADILKIRQIALYKELGYSADQIKKMVTAPDFEWRQVLDEQIAALREKKRHIENLIFAAECMRYFNEMEPEAAWDISDFDNDIDEFSLAFFRTDEEEFTVENIAKVSAELEKKIDLTEVSRIGSKAIDIYDEIRSAMNCEPESEEMQSCINAIFDLMESVSAEGGMTKKDWLFALRMVNNLSIDRMLDILFSKENVVFYLEKALQVYSDYHPEGKEHG